MTGRSGTIAASQAIPVDDEKLAIRVYRALDDVEPMRVSGSSVRVQVSSGVVTLRGVVASFSFKAQVLQAAQGVPGVKRVCDELLTDSELETRIAHALAADLRAHYDIRTQATNGIVVLTGRVSTFNASQAAEAIAARQPGVRAVSNRLRVVSRGGD